MTAPTIGSLFSGYGGLDMAVAAATGARTIWHSDIDPGACRILAHRWPDVPNLGDITAIDWSRVARPDIVTGGFPCTDISAAGQQLGLIRYGDGKTRSGLWAEMCRAIDILRPALVVAENVRALTSVKADSNLEPCQGCVGNEPSEHALRALGAVLGDLADIGYDAQWTGIRASDPRVGACHARFRIIIAAADARSGGFDRWAAGERGWGDQAERQQAVHISRDEGGQRAAADPDCSRLEGVRAIAGEPEFADAVRDQVAAPDTAGDGRREGWPESERLGRRPDAAVGGDVVPHADRESVRQQPIHELGVEGSAVAGQSDATAADSERRGRNGWTRGPVWEALGRTAAAGSGCEPWCQRDRYWVAPTGDDYGPAVRRWHDLTRCVPDPVVRSARGSWQLSPFFDEWLMGLPLGHVTDPEIWAGMKPSAARKAVLKACGNGVVPQQAHAAVCQLLDGTGWLVGAA